MTSNIDRFKADLKSLIDNSGKLDLALLVKVHGMAEVLKMSKGVDGAEEKLKKLPSFNVAYEAWYSESLSLIKQVLPDRLQDFKDHYEVPKNRKEITYATYRIQDALKGLQITRFGDTVVVDTKAAIPHYRQQCAILKAAEKRFESSLFDLRQLVQADLFDSEIAAARELQKKQFFRGAGAIAGVVLEKHLRQVCEDHNLKLAKKNAAISDLNELLKANSVIDTPQWRFISMLGDIRNLCSHNKQQEPTEQQVADLIDGTDKVLKTVT